jgi:alpha-amylase/alpha-mannosidase (GH57 family)
MICYFRKSYSLKVKMFNTLNGGFYHMIPSSLKKKFLVILLGFSFALTPSFSGLSISTINNQPLSGADPVLNLVIIWHQHQPSYQDPETLIYEQPWVFMHGTNSYPYMADVLNDYPDINVTINLTPSLLNQLADYNDSTAYDRRIELYKMDEASMSLENKSIVMQYFFDINSQFRQEGSRYWELTQKKNQYATLEEQVNSFTNQDFLDLKVLFFLHWINPRYTYDGGLLEFLLNHDVAGNHYNPADKTTILNLGQQLVEDSMIYHDDLQNEGRLEIITTPFYHPILPLLINTSNAREVNIGVANLPLPENNTLWTEDALIQIEKGKNYTRDLFGEDPVGMWPSEQAVSDEIIPLVNQTNLQWFVSDYTVLRNSLGVSTLTPEQWFKPYLVEKDGLTSVAFFRHQQLSDEVGFNYGGLNPNTSAQNMIDTLHDFQQNWAGVENPVLTVALDGENAWENYQYDIDGDGDVEYTGNLFREKMYELLEVAQGDGWLRTITPKQYLEEHPPETLDPLNMSTGSWAGDLNIWIGEDEENWAWDQLITTRNDLVQYMTDNILTKEDLPDAWEALYAAEGSDWFWWYGTDRDSGHDELFDWQFKTILRGVYKSIGWSDNEIMIAYPILFLKNLPQIAASIEGKQEPTIDGIITDETEWTLAAHLNHSLANSTDNVIKDLYLSVDEVIDDIHIAINTTDAYDLGTSDNLSFGLYFSSPDLENKQLFPRFTDPLNSSHILGFELATEIRIDLDNTTEAKIYRVNDTGDWELALDKLTTLAVDDIIEMTIPLTSLNIEKGRTLLMNVIATNDTLNENIDKAPTDGPWSLTIPIGGVDMTEVFSMADPSGDEHGIYPTNPQMHPDGDVEQTGLMDILRFRIGYEDDKVYFEFKFRELYNPWNGPGGYSHPLMQVYIDKDNIPGSGSTTCDQNGHFDIEEEHAWEIMVRADGWLQYVLYSNQTMLEGSVETFSDSVDKVIVYSAPISVIGIPTQDWTYTVVVGSQDYQAFRDFLSQPQEWKFGGGDDSEWDPNTVDCLVPLGVDQEAILNSYDVLNQEYSTIPAVGPNIQFQDDTIDPIISIIEPAEDPYEVSLPRRESTAPVNISWEASDNNEIDRFEIYDGNIFLSEYNLTVRSVILELTEGEHIIKVNVFDSAENYTSASITIIVSGSKISGFPIWLLLGSIGVAMGLLIKNKKIKIKKGLS